MAWNLSIRKGDQVKVVAGRDKGKSGRVLAVDEKKQLLSVEHVNMLKRHTRPNPSKQIKGGIVEREGTIHASNVMVLCPSCGKTTRVRRHFLADGSKVRSCHRCGTTLEH
jgi:large subunit ribosomal protein L24